MSYYLRVKDSFYCIYHDSTVIIGFTNKPKVSLKDDNIIFSSGNIDIPIPCQNWKEYQLNDIDKEQLLTTIVDKLLSMKIFCHNCQGYGYVMEDEGEESGSGSYVSYRSVQRRCPKCL